MKLPFLHHKGESINVTPPSTTGQAGMPVAGSTATPKSGHSFLRVFDSILHAIEAAATVAAPIIANFDPIIGGLMSSANQAAVMVESSLTTPGSGAQKAAAVTQSTAAAISVANQILVTQGKKPLPQNTSDVIAQQVGMVVGSLNAVANAVNPPAATGATS